MIFKNNNEKKVVEKFLNRHLIDFLHWANRNNVDLALGELTVAEIHQYTSV